MAPIPQTLDSQELVDLVFYLIGIAEHEVDLLHLRDKWDLVFILSE